MSWAANFESCCMGCIAIKNFSTSSQTCVTNFTDVYDEGEEDEGNPNDDAETIDTKEEDENNEGVLTETTCF